jgi:hypothetical protein
MHHLRYLALLPVLAVLVGPFFLNRVTPLILGMPFLLVWLAGALVLTSLVMAVVYSVDPANAPGADGSEQ